MTRHAFSKAHVGDITLNYEFVDYTAPWQTTEPETFLLYHGYARNMLFWEQWVPLLASDYRHIGGLAAGALLIIVMRRRGVPLFDNTSFRQE